MPTTISIQSDIRSVHSGVRVPKGPIPRHRYNGSDVSYAISRGSISRTISRSPSPVIRRRSRTRSRSRSRTIRTRSVSVVSSYLTDDNNKPPRRERRRRYRSASEVTWTDDEEEKTKKTRVAEYIINATISQDITGGMEQTQNESLAALAAKLLKSHDVAFEKQKRDSENVSPIPARIRRSVPRELTMFQYQTPREDPRVAPPPRAANTLVGEDFDRPSNIEWMADPHPLSNQLYRGVEDDDIDENLDENMDEDVDDETHDNFHVTEDDEDLDDDDDDDDDNEEEDDDDYELERGRTDYPQMPMNGGKVHTRYQPFDTLENNTQKPTTTSHQHDTTKPVTKEPKLATARDIEDFQNALSNLSTVQKEKMTSSDLDPISYYFAHLKGKKSKTHVQKGGKKKFDKPKKKAQAKRAEHIEKTHEKVPVSTTPKEETVEEKLLAFISTLPKEDQQKLLVQTTNDESQVPKARSQAPSHASHKSRIGKASLRTPMDSTSWAEPSSQSLAKSTPNLKSKSRDRQDRRSVSSIPVRVVKQSEDQPASVSEKRNGKARSSLPVSTSRISKDILSQLAAERVQSPSGEKAASSSKPPISSPKPKKAIAGKSDSGRNGHKHTSHAHATESKEEKAENVPQNPAQSSKQRAKEQPVKPSKGKVRAEETPKAEPSKSSQNEIIMLLQQHIAKLESEKLELSSKKPEKQEEASAVQVVYEVNCARAHVPTQYFDKPIRYDPTSDMSHLQGQKPFPRNLELFLEQQRGAVSFLVYKVFDCCRPTVVGDGEKSSDQKKETPHLEERIRVASSNLHETATYLKKEYPIELEHFPTCKVGEEIHSPFLFYYHQRAFIKKLRSLPKKHQAQINLFRRHVESSFGDEFSRVDSMVSQKLITSQYLPYLFEPGKVIISLKDGTVSGFEQQDWPVARTWTKQQYTITGKYWDFDGEFSQKTKHLVIDFGEEKPYKKPISELDLIPLRLAEPIAEEYLRKRGLNYWNCRFRRYMSHSDSVDEHEKLKQGSESRYMVDLVTYQKMHKQFPDPKKGNVKVLSQKEMDADEPPEGNFVLLLPRTVLGFNMQAKQWVELQIDQLSDIDWNKEAFESLVVDQPVKELITALVTNQLSNERSTDLMDGKGTGLIILLHGGPGTGKTLTAESVAELAEKPLYRVTCGDIGTNPQEVEEYLKTILLLGKTWECVVLLDEADVFLEQRGLRDLQRNALVSVFLRVLEYYDGILILTSNRVGTFDEAFKSRIQLALHYEDLEEWQRRSIWENFIRRLSSFTPPPLPPPPPLKRTSSLLASSHPDPSANTLSKYTGSDLGIDTEDLTKHVEELAKQKMNGRQIRNAITTARQLAMYKKARMDYEHLKHVIEVAGKFDRYLFELHEEVDDNQIARDDGLRL